MQHETIVFGGGCFWCTEAIFLMIKGVESVEPGYSGPEYKNEKGPSYEEVSTGTTPYVESAKVVYDPDQIAFPELLQVYFASHDPTTPNRQGNDVGPQYRSAIYTTTPEQLATAERVRDEYQVEFTRAGYGRITTEVKPAPEFYYAEDYHQQYLDKNPNGYCGLGSTGVSCPVGVLGS
jgi:peptide-methionine (S)-S-oxide reductase